MSKKHCWHCHKEIDNTNNESNFICPNCHTEYCDKPKNESILHTLQNSYLLNRNEKTFSKLLIALQPIVYNQLASKLKCSGKFLEECDLEDRISWSMLKIVSLYSDPTFKIETSFISYISSLVLFPLYNYKQQDKDQNEISLFTPRNNSGNNSSAKKENTLFDVMKEETVLDSVGEVENYFFNQLEKDNLVSTVNDFISVTIREITKNKEFVYSLKILTLLDYYIASKDNNKLFTSWWNYEGLEFKSTFEHVLVLFRNMIREANCA